LSRGLSHGTWRATYAPFTPSNSEQRLPPLYYRGCWHRVSRGFLHRYSQHFDVLGRVHSSRSTGVYDPKAFILHAALLRQGFPHCEKFPTAASRRSLGRVSVPVWPSALSGRLPIVALVGRYPANQLIGRGLISKRQALRSPALILSATRGCHAVLAPVSRCYSPLGGRSPTRYSPVRRSTWGLPPFRARLACVRHAASVDSEPGSNSPVKPVTPLAGRPSY
jgi:hypothetical protein